MCLSESPSCIAQIVITLYINYVSRKKENKENLRTMFMTSIFMPMTFVIIFNSLKTS